MHLCCPRADAPAARAPQDTQRTADGKKLLTQGVPFMRDVPYSWNTMVDNLCAAPRCPARLEAPAAWEGLAAASWLGPAGVAGKHIAAR
jgi:hypothetical protein